MTAPKKWTEDARDKIHNLDLTLPEHEAIYEDNLKNYIMLNELNWNFDNTDPTNPFPLKPIINLEIYYDNAEPPKRTIGIGFNMDRPEAKKEWENILKDMSFEDVYVGRSKITEEQAMMLFDHSIKVRRKELIQVFGQENWNTLKPNEKLTIEDMYYNGPNLVRNSIFINNIKFYLASGELSYLEAAINKIENYKQNKERRKINAIMMCGPNNGSRTLPGESSIPKNRVTIIVGKNATPAKHSDTKCIKNERYYIWRTMLDGKVRAEHKKYESKIFDVNNPPEVGE